VWLDLAKTPSFDFYQFWFNTADADVEEYLYKMTLLSKAEIESVMQEQKENPASRAAQRNLAFEVTALVHGETEAEKVAKASEELFSGKAPEDMPSIPGGKLRDIVDGYSMSELRRLVEQGGVTLVESGKKIASIDEEVHGDTIKIGKNRFIKVQ
jgi:tyrosyl-tRNA synthetase